MRKNTFHRRTLLSALLAGSAFIAACGGGSASDTKDDTASAASGVPATAQSSETVSAATVSPKVAASVVDSSTVLQASASIAEIQTTDQILASASAQTDSMKTAQSVSASVSPQSTVAQTSTQTPNLAYVTVQNGHFAKNGQRLRVWGSNLSIVGLGSQSVIDNMVSRLKSLGFNGVRLWPSDSTFYTVINGTRQWITTTKGDNSELDRFDYLVSKLSAAGFSIEMTALHEFGKPSLPYDSSADVRNWINAANGNTSVQLQLLGFAPYLSSDYRAMMTQHYTNLLKRTNPYTGRSYANEPAVSTWEMANESRFVECSLIPSCIQGMPSIAYTELSAAWQASTQWNPSGAALPASLSTLISSPQYSAYAQFLSEQFVNVSTSLRNTARTYGPGVAVQPFLFNTGPGAPQAIAHYTYSRGDGLAMGAYRSPFASTVTGGLEGSPWNPVSMGGPAPSLIEAFKVKDKPFIIYETSFFRPYPYRSEWGPLFAAFGLRQDWDAVFLYAVGVPTNVYTNNGVNSGYGTMPMPEPVPTVPTQSSYSYGFQHVGDAATMASWSLGGKLFLSTNESPQIATLWHLPVSSIFASPNNYGYPGPYLGTIANSRASTTVIDFENDSDTSCEPCTYAVPAPTTFVVNWNTTAKNLTVSTALGTAVTGSLTGNIGQLTPRTSATMSTAGFGLIGAISTDLRSSTTTGDTLFMISKVENTAKIFNPLTVNLALPYGAESGMVAAGTMPLIFSGPTAAFTSTVPVTFTPYAFTLATPANVQRSNKFTFASNLGTFFTTATP